ncbi:N-acetylmuramoyl-L-alanine amidase family protein [Formosa haliotis]|uniref:N-acetylmuramoyl-L-alanine amidase family protein n=1 Tax=Formosa haliotis TaxID=1555194 RepID=UPI0008270950|nr:N-acetylmuramoyl-L-alanine amidase [Formosa haliotis]
MNCIFKGLRNWVGIQLLFFSIFSYSQTIENKLPIVIIDPGHGGTDSGAISKRGLKEKDVVFRIATEMVQSQNNTYHNFEIYLTRAGDSLISLKDRTVLANTLKADLFISLHCNHSENNKASGLEVYVHNQNGMYLRSSIATAFYLGKGLSQALHSEYRGVKFANFQVLRDTSMHMKSILIELGFLSNELDVRIFSKSKNLEFIAKSLLQIITKILEL